MKRKQLVRQVFEEFRNDAGYFTGQTLLKLFDIEQALREQVEKQQNQLRKLQIKVLIESAQQAIELKQKEHKNQHWLESTFDQIYHCIQAVLSKRNSQDQYEFGSQEFKLEQFLGLPSSEKSNSKHPNTHRKEKVN